MSETLKALETFRDLVVTEAKANLQRLGKDTSGKLSNSIKGNVKEMPNSIGVYFEMEPYGNFQDKGVSGTERKYPGTDYSYKPGIQNRPSPRHFDKWVVKKGLAPRGTGGKFAKRSGIKFALAYHIQKYGIKPSLFFTKPFEEAYKTLPDTLIDKYGLDAERELNSILNQNLKNIK